MILFECDGSFTEELFDEGVDCSHQENLPGIPYLKCRSNALVAGWAVGGEVKEKKINQLYNNTALFWKSLIMK